MADPKSAFHWNTGEPSIFVETKTQYKQPVPVEPKYLTGDNVYLFQPKSTTQEPR